MVQIRQTAFKVWIADLINGRYVKEEGEWTPNYVLVRDDLKVSRVNLIASVVSKNINEDSSYGFLTVDDGTSSINLKAWRDDINILSKREIGDLINIIGRVREYSEGLYVIPEVVKKLEDPNWAKVRKLELEKLYGKPPKIKNKDISEKKIMIEVQDSTPLGIIVKEESANEPSQTNRQKVLKFIGKKDEISYDDLFDGLEIDEKEVESIIKELLREGEIYQPKPNYLKVI